MREFGDSFLFGNWSREDLLHEAYLWAAEALPRWDPEKGNVYTFLRWHLRNKLCNLKRDKWERRDTPCLKCPLGKWERETDRCLAYLSKDDCEWWRGWQRRNAVKRSIAGGGGGGDRPAEGVWHDSVGDRLEREDTWRFCLEIVRDREGLLLVLEGGKLGRKRWDALVSELRELFEGEEGVLF